MVTKRYMVFLFSFFIIFGIGLSAIYGIKDNIVEDDYIDNDNNGWYVPIVMYHQVKNVNLSKDVISLQELEYDFKYLKKRNYNTITMTELIDYVYNDKKIPDNPIIITFDDGYLTTYKNVFPLIKKYDIKIVLSIIGKSTDDFTQVMSKNINSAHLNWNQLNEMISSGLVEVQNHSYDLHTKVYGRNGCTQKSNETFEEYKEVLSEDLKKLQMRLLQYSGVTPNAFTYPYGRYNENTVKVIKELGFKASLSCKYGINHITKDSECLYSLKRACRSHGYSIDKLISDVYKTIK